MTKRSRIIRGLFYGFLNNVPYIRIAWHRIVIFNYYYFFLFGFREFTHQARHNRNVKPQSWCKWLTIILTHKITNIKSKLHILTSSWCDIHRCEYNLNDFNISKQCFLLTWKLHLTSEMDCKLFRCREIPFLFSNQFIQTVFGIDSYDIQAIV